MITNKINIKIYNNINNELEKDWLDFEKNSNLNIFQSFFFIKNFIKGKDEKYVFVVLSSSEKIFCILPLHINKKFGLKILQWIGTKELDYCGPLISNFQDFASNKKNFKQLWIRILKNFNDLDFIFLNKQLRKINTVENPFVIYLNNNIFSKIFSIHLNSNYEDYLKANKNKKFLSEFQRTKKILISENEVEFLDLDANNKVLNLDKIISQKAKYLEKRKIKHHLDNEMIELFNNLKKEFSDYIKVGVLKINNEIIAASIGFIFRKRFYYYMPVIFSDKFSKFSPGKVLISHLIELSIKKRLKTFDFGLGDENYKKYWSNNVENISRHFDYKSLKGFAAYCALKVYIFVKKIL